MSFLATVGKDFKAIFAWLGSTKGQAVVSGVEGTAEAVATAIGAGAVVQAGIDLVNKWLAEILKVESLSAAAAEQTGSGATKAAAVIAAVTPSVTAFATANGLPAPTAASLTTINTALVSVLNTLGANPAP